MSRVVKDPLSWSSFSFWLVVVAITPALAVLATLVTGYLYFAYGGWGFPAPWRGLVFQICPLMACTVNGCPICNSSIDWVSFGVDILFYTAIGYSLVLVLSWGRPARPFLAATDPSIK